jgi:YD repeat-containing protein
VGFLDVDAPCWLPVIPFISQSFNDGVNFRQRHAIHRFSRDAFGRRSSVAVNLAIRFEVEFPIEQVPIEPFQRQAFAASFTNDP